MQHNTIMGEISETAISQNNVKLVTGFGLVSKFTLLKKHIMVGRASIINFSSDLLTPHFKKIKMDI